MHAVIFFENIHYITKNHLSLMVKLQRGEFRQATEDRHTHLYQNPWYAL